MHQSVDLVTARNFVVHDMSPRGTAGNSQVEDTRDCTDMFFRVDKARLRQGILDCNETSCDCADDTQEVRKKSVLGKHLLLFDNSLCTAKCIPLVSARFPRAPVIHAFWKAGQGYELINHLLESWLPR